MKYLLLSIFCFSSLFSFGQNVNNGIYFNSKEYRGFETEIFEFKENKKFNYLLFTCTGTGFGTGTYKLIKDSIYFNFSNLTKSLSNTDLKFVKSDTDSLSINFKILESNSNQEIPQANLSFIKEKVLWSTDWNGNVNKKIIRNNSTRTLRIDFLGYEPVEIEIPQDISEVNGIIRLGNFWTFNSTYNLNFKVLSKNNTNFTLLRYEGKYIKYKKMKKTKISKIVEEQTGKTYDYFIDSK